MKKIIMSAISFLFMFSALAQTDTTKTKSTPKEDKYCIESRHHKAIVMHQKVVITLDVTLHSGDIIRPDGTLKRLDGTVVLMIPGECVDQEGKIHMAISEEKVEKN